MCWVQADSDNDRTWQSETGHPHNCPALRETAVERCAVLAKTGVHHHSGSTIELGIESAKYCGVCTLALIDPGDSDSIRSMPGQTSEK